eukprot:335330_1
MSSNKKKKSHFLKNLRDKVRGRNDKQPSPNGTGSRNNKHPNNKHPTNKHGSSLGNNKPHGHGSHSGSSSSHYNGNDGINGRLTGPPTLDELLLSLPSIREVKEPDEKRRLFIRKLRLCSYTFDFNKDAQKKEAEAREMKRRMLVELIDHLSSSKIWVSEQSLKAILHMISCNLFRPLPPSLYKDFDPDEDEPTHDPAWVHLQFVYEFLLRFIVSNNTDAKMLKKFIDRKFLLSVINLFKSEDPRERDYLKTILHRIYGKFMSFRSFLRRA